MDTTNADTTNADTNNVKIEINETNKMNEIIKQKSKRFEKLKITEHAIHIYHNIFTIIIWLTIIILIIDFYIHFLPHSIHGVILWFELCSYTIFLWAPVIIEVYKNFKRVPPNKLKTE